MQDIFDRPSAGFATRAFTRRQAVFTCVVAALSALCSGGLCVAAVLLHPPLAIIPLLVVTCVGCPVFGTWELPHALATLRADSRRRAIAMFRRSLEQLPETRHPLGR